MRSILRNCGVPVLVAALVFSTSGCGGTPTTKTGQTENEKKDAEKKLAELKETEKKEADKKLAEKKSDTTEDGYWCIEHGIPEKECSMCQADVEKACRAKGDWCEKHPDRAKSQCFKCDISLKAKYDAKYKAHYKTDKDPPAINLKD